MNLKNPPQFVSGGKPIIGHTLEFRQNLSRLDQRGHKEHGDVFAMKLMNQNMAVVTGADYNKKFYLETDKSLNITDVYSFLKASFGEVLFIAPHEEYMNQRPILQAIFSRTKMADYLQAMQVEVQAWLDGLGDEEEIDISAETLNLTQAVAGRAFISPNYKAELGESFWQDYDAISRSIDPVTPPNWPLPKFWRRDAAKQRIQKRLKQLIAKRRENPDAYDDLITQLFEQPKKDGQFMTDEEITILFMGLIFAGHETTAGQAAWNIILLLQHPDYLRQVQDEIGANTEIGQPLDGRVMRSLQHVYWAIDETARLRPSAPMQLRIVEEPIEFGEHVIPSGWLLRVSSATSHYQEEVFANPEVYDPQRFSQARGEGKNSFNLVSFGGGMHKCTGMNFANNEMAVITTLLFQQFDVELITPDPQVLTGVGANRATEAIIRYRKK
ncbi:cytochrome P450 [Candidatus Leptofilum sp.]|uniref:cytochrome P450 n=1 Tax=Candidatus Leptofilum sp. TaxID=3241576 RepID=UPI003B5CA5EE